MKSKGLAVLIILFLFGCVLSVNEACFAQGSCALQTPPNLVPNPGFEDDVDSNSIPDGWEVGGYGDWDLNSPGHDNATGTKSLKLATDSDKVIELESEDYIEVDPEFKYKLSYYAKGSATKFNIAWAEYDENYDPTLVVYHRGIRDASRESELTGDWQQIDNIEFYSLDRTKYVKFYIEVDNGTVWIDDVRAVALTRARILYTVIYDFETFTVDLQTGDEYDVADVYVELALEEWDAYNEQWGPVPGETEIVDLDNQTNNSTHAFPADGMRQYGVGKYKIVATCKCDDGTVVYEEEFPVYVVEQPERTEGGVFRVKKEIIDEADNTTSVIFDPYFPVFFAHTNTDGEGMDLLKSKGIYDLANANNSMVFSEGDLVHTKGMHAGVYSGYSYDDDNTSWSRNNDYLYISHNKPSLLWWYFMDEPFWRINKGEVVPVSDMIEDYYTVRTTFDGVKRTCDGEICEAIPLVLNEEVIYDNPVSRSYTDDSTHEDIIAYTNATDIVMDDEYAVVHNLPLSKIAEVMEALKMHSRGVKPPMIWLTCGWQTIQPKVTPADFRAQTYMALVHGAKGIGYYSFAEPEMDNATLWYLPRDNPALWTFMGDFMQELDMVKDIFLHGEDSNAVTVTSVDDATDEYGYEAAHYSAKTYINQSGDNGTYVFIVNGFDEDIQAIVEGPVGPNLTINLPPYGTVFLVETDTACPTGTAGVGAWCMSDFDNDTIADTFDNCLLVANPNQDDRDNDSIGDACDECNNDSSCCDYVGTLSDHIGAQRTVGGGEYWWTNAEDLICFNDCDWETIYHLLEYDTSRGDYYYDNDTCFSEDLVSCTNGKDDDNDYLIDCDDPDCIMSGSDTDNDSIDDVCDNCQLVSNSNQMDTDNDGIGDACDNCLQVANLNQTDTDNDSIGDECDNCPDIANGPLAGTCYNYYTGAFGSGTCMSSAECQDNSEWYKWCDIQQQDLDGNGTGDVCEE